MKQLRVAAGYRTQEALAEDLGVNRSSIAKWESGAAYPRAEMLQRLAKLLRCSVDEIVASIKKSRHSAMNEQLDARKERDQNVL